MGIRSFFLLAAISLVAGNSIASASGRSFLGSTFFAATEPIGICLRLMGISRNPNTIEARDFGAAGVEYLLLKQRRELNRHQAELALRVKKLFQEGVRFSTIAEEIRISLRSWLLLHPTGTASFDKDFALRRTAPSTSIILSPSLSQSLHWTPAAAAPAMSELTGRLTREFKGMEMPQTLIERITLIRPISYETLDGDLFTGKILFNLWASFEPEDVFITSPFFSATEVILDDIEARLATARMAPREDARNEFLRAWYGYEVASPFIHGNHTIGATLFSGLALALFDKKLERLPSAVDLIHWSSQSADAFVDHFLQ